MTSNNEQNNDSDSDSNNISDTDSLYDGNSDDTYTLSLQCQLRSEYITVCSLKVLYSQGVCMETA